MKHRHLRPEPVDSVMRTRDCGRLDVGLFAILSGDAVCTKETDGVLCKETEVEAACLPKVFEIRLSRFCGSCLEHWTVEMRHVPDRWEHPK